MGIYADCHIYVPIQTLLQLRNIVFTQSFFGIWQPLFNTFSTENLKTAMLRNLICTIGLFVFGVLYAEILNGLNIFNFQMNVYLFAGLVSVIFFISESILKHFEKEAKKSSIGEIKFQKAKDIYYIGLAILGFILLILIPFVWWGAIKTLADMAK